MDPSTAFARLVRFIMRDTTYHALYVCTVQGQSEDLSTLHLLPDSPKIRGTGTQAVPVLGLPGIKMRVQNGTKVLIGFRNGNPDLPYCAAFPFVGNLELTLQPDGDVNIISESTIRVQSPNVLLGAAPGAGIATAGEPVIIPPSALIASLSAAFTASNAATAAAAIAALLVPLVGAVASGSESAKA